MAQVPRGARPERLRGLMFAVCLTVAAGGILSILARVPLSVPSNALNLNTVTPEKLALALEVDLRIADRVVQERERLGRFASVARAAATPVVPDGPARERARSALKQMDLNAADARGFAEALDIPQSLAQRIVEERTRRPGGRFSSAEDVLSVSALPPAIVRIWQDRLIVRTPAQALLNLLGSLVVFLLLGALLQVWWERYASASDPFLVPLAWLLAGIALISILAMHDPLREEIRAGRLMFAQALGAVALVVVYAAARRRVRPAGLRDFHGSRSWYGALLFVVWVLVGLTAGRSLSATVPSLPWLGVLLAVLAAAELLTGLHAADLTTNEQRPAGRPRIALLAMALPAVTTVLVSLAGRSHGASLVTSLAVTLLLLTQVRHLAAVALSGILGVGTWVISMLLSRNGGELLADWFVPTFRPAEGAGRLQESLWALASGGLSGSGLGLGMTSAIPRPESALYAVIGEELGIVGCTLVSCAATVLIWRAFRTAAITRAIAMRPYAAAVASFFAGQLLCTVGGATGLSPALDILMPFGSPGRLLEPVAFGCLGFVIACSAHTSSAHTSTTRAVRRRTSALSASLAALFLGVVGFRTVYIQGFAGGRIAGQQITVASSEATHELSNPRLQAIARRIPRGSVYDVAGRVLATSRLREISDAIPGDAVLARRYYRAGRYYPFAEACVAVVGQWDALRGATSGIERELDTHLRGYADLAGLLAEYQGKDLPTWLRKPALAGGDVVLSIDAEQQRAALAALKKHCVQAGAASSGVVVVLSALQGHPVVAVGTPAPDPNSIVLHPVRGNNASPAGSVSDPDALWNAPSWCLKLATVLSLTRDRLSFETECRHSLAHVSWHSRGAAYSAARVEDHPTDAPHGRIGVRRALKLGCNVFFAELAARLGPERLFSGMAALGIGDTLGGEQQFARRMVPLIADQAPLELSPMQCASLVAAVTAQAAPVRPQYWHELRSSNPARSQFAEPAIEHRALPEIAEPAAIVQRALKETVQEGPLERIFHDVPAKVAGRTATAQRANSPDGDCAWFLGYAPQNPPAYVIVTAVRPSSSGYATAAPLAADVLRGLIRP